MSVFEYCEEMKIEHYNENIKNSMFKSFIKDKDMLLNDLLQSLYNRFGDCNLKLNWTYECKCEDCGDTYMYYDEENSYDDTLSEYLDEDSFYRKNYGLFDYMELCDIDNISLDYTYSYNSRMDMISINTIVVDYEQMVTDDIEFGLCEKCRYGEEDA